MLTDINEIRKALKDNPRDANLLRHFGYHLLVSGNYRSAKEQYRLAVFYDPHFKAKIVLDYEKVLGVETGSIAVRLSLAEFYLSIGEVDNAIFEFEEALDLDPENAAVYNVLGKIYLNCEMVDKAIALLERSLKRGVSDIALTEMLAGAYLEKKKYAPAITLFKDVLTYNPANKKILRVLGELNTRISKYEEAASYFSKMFSDDPEVAREVILRLEELAQRAPTSVRIKEILADIYFRSMQPDRSVSMFEKIIELDPSLLDAAITNCRKVLKSYPSHPAAIISLAKLLTVKGEYSEAAGEYLRLARVNDEYLDQSISGYKDIIKTCPDQVLAHQYLADSYMQKGNVNEAILEYEAALMRSPDIAEDVISRCKELLKSHPHLIVAHRVLGQAYLAAGDLRKAVSKAEEIISIDKKYAVGYCILGEAYAGLKLSRKASDALHTALELDPFNQRIHAKFKEMKERELRLAIESNLTKLQEDPWKVSLHLDLGKLYYSLGENDKAVTELQASLKDRIRAPFAYNLIGNCYRLEGRFDLARQNYEKALEVVPAELDDFKKILIFNLGASFEASGALMKAVEAYEEVLQIDNEFGNLKKRLKNLKSSKLASLRNKKIMCVLRDLSGRKLIGVWGRESMAGEKAARAEAINMSFGQNHNTDGFDLFMRGMDTGAREEFSLAVALDSSFAPGLNNLAVMQILEEEFDPALKNLEAAIDEDFDSPVFYNNLGVLYYLRGNLDEAIKILEKAKNLNDRFSAIDINLGNFLYVKGEVARALELFQQVTADDVLGDIAKQWLQYKVP